jgi:Predicted restriction endonuclease
MLFWVGITDDDWFIHLSRLKPDEVNFWQPGPTPPRHMDPGTLFLFKLHAPHHVVVGGGYFVRFTVLPCFLAWEAFGEKNGVTSLPELVQRMTRYRHSQQTSGSEIGCNILVEPFFFPEEDWIPIPENWSPPIQRGLTYDTNDKYGAELWQAVQQRIARNVTSKEAIADQDTERYGNEYLARARLGQGSFRILVTDAYHRRCAVTNEKALPALEAAHIKSYSKSGPHRTSNGLLLRADIHRLFDDGYVTLDPDLRFLVSERVREQFENGREYYRFHGAKLQNLPDSIDDLPSKEFIKWHNEECFERI